MDLGIKNGEVDLKQLSADLYQGKLMLNAQVDARSKVSSYQFDKQISGVQIQPLLKDAAKLDILAGTANFNVKGKGKSLIPEQLKKNLLANGRFDITDGALLAQALRVFIGLLAGNHVHGGQRLVDFRDTRTTTDCQDPRQAKHAPLHMKSPIKTLGQHK